MQLGVGLSSEELGPTTIVRAVALAEEVGFRAAWVSDHFHPWIDAQGESPFVWSVLGGIARATDRIRVGTGVTCPIMRMHPALIAQAAATTQCMFDGRFWLGVGSGEALNEHVVGRRWPDADVRLEMLAEACEIIRALWTGEQVSRRGSFFEVENARLYTLPEERPQIFVSAFGRKSAELAARIGDGLVSTKRDSQVIDWFTAAGGRGPKLAQLKVAWAEKVTEAEELALARWPTAGVEGELSQDLPTPRHFEQAVATVRKSDVVDRIVCGPDPQRHFEAISAHVDAGYDEVYVTQVGPDQEGFLRFYEQEILPNLRGVATSSLDGAGA